MIDEILSSVNDNDEVVTQIKGFCGNKAVEYMFDKRVDASELGEGDIIQITLNSNNEIVNKKLLLDESNLTYKDEGGFYSNTRKVIGKVCRSYPTAKRFALNLDGTTELKDDTIWGECSRVASNIYVYDRSISRIDNIGNGYLLILLHKFNIRMDNRFFRTCKIPIRFLFLYFFHVFLSS